MVQIGDNLPGEIQEVNIGRNFDCGFGHCVNQQLNLTLCRRVQALYPYLGHKLNKYKNTFHSKTTSLVWQFGERPESITWLFRRGSPPSSCVECKTCNTVHQFTNNINGSSMRKPWKILVPRIPQCSRGLAMSKPRSVQLKKKNPLKMETSESLIKAAQVKPLGSSLWSLAGGMWGAWCAASSVWVYSWPWSTAPQKMTRRP